MADVPIVGGDKNVWGTKLNTFLNVAHETSGANGGKVKHVASNLLLDNFLAVAHETSGANAGQINLSERIRLSESEQIKLFGYSADSTEIDQGVTGNGKTIKAFIDVIGSAVKSIVLKSGNFTLATSLVVPSNVTLIILPGAKIVRSGSATLIINSLSQVEAGSRQAFSGFNAGDVTFGSDYKGYVNPFWFGVVADWNGTTGTNNADALQAALIATPASGTIWLPPMGATKGISFSTGLTLGPHGKRIIGNNAVMKYTGTGNGFTLDGDNTRAEDILLIGNPGATSAFKFINNNGTYFSNLKVYGTGGIAFDLEGGPLGGVFMHCGVDHNMGVHDTLVDEVNWGGNPSIVFKLREHIPSAHPPNSVTFIAPQLTLSSGNLTGIGFDISAGTRPSIINGIFQNMNIGVKVYDGGYASGAKPIQVNLINPHFESGTINTYISDAFAAQANNYGLGVDIVGDKARWSAKDFGAGEGETLWVQSRLEADVTHISGKIAIKGNTNTGSGIKGVATQSAGKGIHGVGMNTGNNYAGYFEKGIFHTQSWNPKLRTTAVDYVVDIINDVIIYVSATGKTITLPAPSVSTGCTFTVKLLAAGTGTVNMSGGGNIDSAATYSLSAQYKYVMVQSDGTNYLIIGGN